MSQQESETIKHDRGKLQLSLVPVKPIEELTRLYMFGVKKYAANNWRMGKGWDYTRCEDALRRHLNSWSAGEDYDDESKCHHMACVAFYAFAIIEYHLCNMGRDDRFKPPTPHQKLVESVREGIERNITTIRVPIGHKIPDSIFDFEEHFCHYEQGVKRDDPLPDHLRLDRRTPPGVKTYDDMVADTKARKLEKPTRAVTWGGVGNKWPGAPNGQ